MTPQPGVTLRQTFAAPPDRVFQAFASAEALARWCSPHPDIAVEVLAFRFAVGGSFRLRYVMPGGEEKFVQGRYQRIAAPSDLAFTWTWAPPDPHAGIATLVSVAFLDRGGATELVLTHGRLPDAPAAARYTEGWRGTLDRLATLFTAPQGPSRSPRPPQDQEGRRHA